MVFAMDREAPGPPTLPSPRSVQAFVHGAFTSRQVFTPSAAHSLAERSNVARRMGERDIAGLTHEALERELGWSGAHTIEDHAVDLVGTSTQACERVIVDSCAH